MAVKVFQFLAIMLTAISLVPGGAHVAEMPAKMRLEGGAYHTVQQLYAGWSYFGWALLTFVAAGATDALDGLIARLAHQKTDLGAWLDPAADKLLLVSTFVVLTLPNLGLVNRIPIWLTVLIISRDIGIVLTVATWPREV